MRPLQIEIDIIRSPYDKRRCLKALQLLSNRYCVTVIESGEESLEVLRPLFTPDQRSQVFLDSVVTYLFRMFIGGTQSSGRSIDLFV
jgi:hypothetical protein